MTHYSRCYIGVRGIGMGIWRLFQILTKSTLSVKKRPSGKDANQHRTELRIIAQLGSNREIRQETQLQAASSSLEEVTVSRLLSFPRSASTPNDLTPHEFQFLKEAS